jgi:hypothetical protein
MAGGDEQAVGPEQPATLVGDGGAGGGPAVEPLADAPTADTAYHLHVEPPEAAPIVSALRLLISDEAHERAIRGYARGVLSGLDAGGDERGMVVLALSAPQLKILHTAVKLLHDDLGRDQADERRVLAGVLEKLPDEHAIRAIRID